MQSGIWVALVTTVAFGTARAEAVQVAVAVNFSAPMQTIAAKFERETGHTILISTGSTGKLYAQIRNGAPFDVFLAADQDTPKRLINEGNALPDTSFTYATGRLVLWSAKPDFVDNAGLVLKAGKFTKIAIASPKIAPYGAAAMQVMSALDLRETGRDKVVQGESIGQTFGFVSSGNADLGFVAMSQVFENGRLKGGSAWVVPQALYQPLHQDAVLLMHGKGNVSASALLQFLKTDQAREVMGSYGYSF